MAIRRLASTLLLSLAISATVTAQGTRLLRHPTVSRDSVAFEYAGDLWAVSRSGGQARRLTSTAGVEIDPYFSPDGSQIAFTATVAGNTDVYVMPTTGGDSKRLTYHPGIDRVSGWTPDGRRIIFSSARTSAPQQSYCRLWTIGLDGGLPEALPMPRAWRGAYSPDGRKFAYQEITTSFIPDWDEASFWRHYRGGRTQPIRLICPTTQSRNSHGPIATTRIRCGWAILSTSCQIAIMRSTFSPTVQIPNVSLNSPNTMISIL